LRNIYTNYNHEKDDILYNGKNRRRTAGKFSNVYTVLECTQRYRVNPGTRVYTAVPLLIRYLSREVLNLVLQVENVPW
jgi:hypothetical protein